MANSQGKTKTQRNNPRRAVLQASMKTSEGKNRNYEVDSQIEYESQNYQMGPTYSEIDI